MIWENFVDDDIKKLWRPNEETGKYSGGQITIVGGSNLFHGAPILALKAASRIVSMVFFATPDKDQAVADEVKIKASLASFIWVPRDDLNGYIAKSDAVLIGPGLMRNRNEADGWACDESGRETREMTEKLLADFSDKKWVIDGGSLQVLKPELLPKGAIITPNRKEYEMLFGEKLETDSQLIARQIGEQAKKWGIVIVHKDRTSLVTDGDKLIQIEGGGNGLTSGGVGDLLAGLIVAFAAKNESLLAAAAASYLLKKTAEELEEERGLMFSSDDVAERIPITYGRLVH
jgi:ADP-dependent NAD(P)H-hydrate dehydratase / NAD(P)H-hydrate epimerase